MEAFFEAFAQVLAFFYDFTGNYAIAIILLTLVVMIVVTPLTLKGTRSMMVMQQLQPEMRKIQTRYKDDRQKLNEELLKFYKENSINPLGGCLPLLVQMPVFLVLYQVLSGLTRRVSDLGASVGWVAGQSSGGATPTSPPSFERVFDPTWISPSSKMYQDLSNSFQMEAFGLDLSESTSDAISVGIVHALPFLILIVIVAATGFIQQRQIQGRSTGTQINPQQQMIMKIMPFFLPVISFGLPSGLVLYFAVSNIYRIGQQAFISKSIYGLGAADGTSSWKHLFGFGVAPTSGSSRSGGSRKKSRTTRKGASASSRSGSGRAKPKASVSSGEKKGARSASTPSVARGTKSGDRTSTKSRSSAGDVEEGTAPPPLQPRARKKKR